MKEEGQDRPAGEPLPLAEQADPEVETADLLGLGDEAGPVGEASVASEPSASVPELRSLTHPVSRQKPTLVAPIK